MPEGVIDRLCRGLGVTPKKLASLIGVPYKEVEPLLGLTYGQQSDAEYDEVWRGIARLVDERLGLLLAAREDLQAKIQRDRMKRLARREAIRNR
jgi:hypothetical protein